LPVHVPFVVVIAEPNAPVPDAAGATVLAGFVYVSTVIALLDALPDPAVLVAVTTHVTDAPLSAG
jgi:hypothetical protein